MENKKEITIAANKIIELEQKIQKEKFLDKNVKLYQSQIEDIMERFSLNELIELINTVENSIN